MRAVDLFAGWGGMTAGATEAGADVVYAANHWRLAVDAHAANHPDTEHVCQDLRQADWTALPSYDLLLASPACQGHSSASRPKRRRYHDNLRATAWSVVDCADVTQPQALVVENVPDFVKWRLYPVWRAALEMLGYELRELRVIASHHGVPQRRDRVFVVGLRRPSHVELVRRGPEPAFGPCIEWGRGEWRPVSKAQPGAQRRIRGAQKRHGRRCIVQHVTGHKGLALSEPLRTVTGADQWCVTDGPLYRPLTVRETARAMGFEDSYRWPEHATRRDCIKGLGNAVAPPVARDVVAAVMEAM
ncbi:MAG TPA: DNA cytosine methyltransferase [Myxococcota bacterium]